jgi:hypothetical protein
MTITSLPRPALIAIVGAVAAIALFAMTRRGAEPATTSTDVPAATPPNGSPQAGQPVTGSPGGNPSAPVGGTVKPEATGAPATKARPAPERSGSGARQDPSSRSTRLPAPVKRALDARKIVVLLFWNPAGTDDRSVKKALSGLSRRGGKVAVFSDRLKRVTRYTQITAATNLSQTPTLVVVNRRGQARVTTGYLDRTSIEQLVVDAQRGA